MISKKRIALISKAGLTGAAAVTAMLVDRHGRGHGGRRDGHPLDRSLRRRERHRERHGLRCRRGRLRDRVRRRPAAGTLVCDVAGIKQLTTDATGAARRRSP